MSAVAAEAGVSRPTLYRWFPTKALLLGAGRAEVITQWRNSGQGAVPGTPHVFLANGDEWHNPGFAVQWTGEPGEGFPTVLSYDPTVYDEIVQAAAGR